MKNKIMTTDVTGKEMLGHALGGFGQNLIYAIWGSYMMIFYTDTVGLTAAFVGMIFFIARIWDAVNDPIMGMLADRTRTKFGRFRPWLLCMPIPMVICLALNFTAPNLSNTAIKVYATVTYIMMSMAFTAVDVPYWSLPSAMTSDPNKRTKIFAFASLSTSLAGVVGGITIIPLVNSIGKGNDAKGFLGTAIVIGIIGAIFYLICFSMVKEHVIASTEKFNYKNAVRALSDNKPLLLVLIATLSVYLGLILKNSLQLYYVQYNLGSLNLVPIFSFLSLPGIIIGALVAPILCKKFGKVKVLIFCNIVLLSAGIVFFFCSYTQIGLILAMSAIQVTAIGAAMVVVTSMIADTIEYAEWKTGQRNEGIISSTKTFITKVATAFAGLLAAGILTFSGYVPNAIQSDITLRVFHIVASILPGILGMLSCIPLKWYELTEERHLEIREEIKLRKEKKEQ